MAQKCIRAFPLPSNVLPRPIGAHTQVFLCCFKPLLTHIGPCKFPKSVLIGPFWDQNRVKRGSKSNFPRTARRSFRMLKMVVFSLFALLLNHLCCLHRLQSVRDLEHRGEQGRYVSATSLRRCFVLRPFWFVWTVSPFPPPPPPPHPHRRPGPLGRPGRCTPLFHKPVGTAEGPGRPGLVLRLSAAEGRAGGDWPVSLASLAVPRTSWAPAVPFWVCAPVRRGSVHPDFRRRSSSANAAASVQAATCTRIWCG